MNSKRIVLLILLCLFLTGCSSYYLNSKSLEEAISLTMSSTNKSTNTNNKGYKYYLPIDFEVYEDNDYNQILLNNGYKYYMYVDVVSYFYKNVEIKERDNDDYFYYSSDNCYIKVKEEDKKYFIEISYNYAIIEVRVDKSSIKSSIVSSLNILKSIKYNDLYINNYIKDNTLENSESVYEIPSPEEKSDMNVLEYIEENENNIN